MAEGLLRHDAGERLQVFSAGVSPSPIRQEAVTVMRELGIDISGYRSKHVNEFAGQTFDYVLTVCNHAHEQCPVFPGRGVMIHRSFVDPALLDDAEQERLELFRQVRDQIREFLREFLITFPAV
jgi:arsenate reductase (thioredoxin)